MRLPRIVVAEGDVLARRFMALQIRNALPCSVDVVSSPGDIQTVVSDLEPDIVLLALERDDHTTLNELEALKAHYPGMAVFVLTERSEKGAEMAVAAIRKGAVDFITKPQDKNALLFADRHLEKRLAPVVEIARQIVHGDVTNKQIEQTVEGFRKNQRDPPGSAQSIWPIEIVAVAGCTGGPDALFSLLPKLPANLPVPIVINQHFPKYYTSVLARELNEVSDVRVEEAKNGSQLKAGGAYVAPGGFHLEVRREGGRTTANLHRGLREKGNRPSVDLLFNSVAENFGMRALGIILSGGGNDGLEGAMKIKQKGGRILIQDPLSAALPSLPMAILKANLADGIYKPEELATQIVEKAKRWLLTRRKRKGENIFKIGASDMF